MPLLPSHKINKSKTANLKFTIDCAQPVEDKVILASDFEDYLRKKIKVGGKTGNLGENITVNSEGSKVVITSSIPFAKRYLKYLTKRYLKKNQLRDYLHVVSKDKSTYMMKYFKIQNDEIDEE